MIGRLNRTTIGLIALAVFLLPAAGPVLALGDICGDQFCSPGENHCDCPDDCEDPNPDLCDPCECGGSSGGATCFCDDLCGVFGDCCANVCEACETCATLGACCVDGGVDGAVAGIPPLGCGDTDERTCVEVIGGEFLGAGTTCADDPCTPPGRISASKKGSFLAYSKIELKWDSGGDLTQDTILELTNDYPDDVCVQLYLVNGDAPLEPVVDDLGTVLVEGEPGWNWVDCGFCLTRDQPTYWSAATGLPAGCQPFEVLDPAGSDGIPGRPDPDVAGGKILRGFVYAWAVDNEGCQIRWNHLSGGATLVNYANTTAWEYNAWAAQVSDVVSQGQRAGECGGIRMDGAVYDQPYDMLLMDFYQPGSTALSSGSNVVSVDTDLTLHPVTADLRQDSMGPVTTKAKFDIWNEDERSFSGTTRCITCWDQTLLSQYGNPNNFINLQADRGKARINGIQSDVCDVNCIREEGNSTGLHIDSDLLEIFGIDHVCSFDVPLLGVVAKHLGFSAPVAASEAAGRNLTGMGREPGFVLYDIIAPPGELESESASPAGDRRKTVKSPMGDRGRSINDARQSDPVAPPAE